jgi:hypothetical protein
MTEVHIDTERVDDIPVLIQKQRLMGIPQVLDEVIQPHGNWQGLSVGSLTSAWLAYILSEADHRMCEVEPWAAKRLETLSALLSEAVGEKDFTDDAIDLPQPVHQQSQPRELPALPRSAWGGLCSAVSCAHW